MKVFCKDCKYIEFYNGKRLQTYNCLNPKYCGVVKMDDTFFRAGETSAYTGDPKVQNVDNHCKGFKLC